jgi:DNA-directed RNA polymerase sigma subunit (sigma70/sigma32)
LFDHHEALQPLPNRFTGLLRGPRGSEYQSNLHVWTAERVLHESDCSIQLTDDEENDVARRIINEECAASRERLVRANLRLVVAIARKYTGRGLTRARLIEAGAAGLVRAVEDFDPSQGARFSTCASWWIKHAIRQASMSLIRFKSSPDTAA